MPGFTLARGLPVVGPSCSARGQPCTAQTPARAVRNSLAAGRVGTSLKHGRTAVISSVVRRSSAVCSTANSWEQLAREQQAAKNWWQVCCLLSSVGRQILVGTGNHIAAPAAAAARKKPV